MNINMINKKVEEDGLKYLTAIYDQKKIPPEKKPYLSDLKNSFGPYIAVDSKAHESCFFQDAASQIATLGLGLNPTALFGTGQFLEAWSNHKHSPQAHKLRKSYEAFLQKKLAWDEMSAFFCHSGAEACETALGLCYQQRAQTSAHKVLAFEGSFHGRMLISLSSTWNPSKREPFEWQNYLTAYAPFPPSKKGEIHPKVPRDWRKIWANATHRDFKIPPSTALENDELLACEIKSLLIVREKLLSQDIFAIIIEPMQCEGGDRYGTARFFNGLILMAKSFHVPIIFDEVQTGFHLGPEFFWHREFDLKDQSGASVHPDFLICAKKAQTGIVLSPQKNLKNAQTYYSEEFNFPSLIRGYLQGLTLDQNQDKIIKLEQDAFKHLTSWCTQFPKELQNPRCHGLSFAIDFRRKEKISEFIAARFSHGLLFYPAGDQTLRFRLNLAYKDIDLKNLFTELLKISQKVFLEKKMALPKTMETTPRNSSELYLWHHLLLENKILQSRGEIVERSLMLEKIHLLLKLPSPYKLIVIDRQNFASFKEKIGTLQQSIYEPARQTSLDQFENIICHKFGIALGIIEEKEENLLAYAFASSLEDHPLERGVRNDPDSKNPKALYMLDLTLSKSLQGQGLGSKLKYSLFILAQSMGAQSISGRNRDRLAKNMLNINLSLGAYIKSFIPEDYPDFEKYRDVLYYTCPTKWESPPLYFDDGIDSPTGILAPPLEFCEKNMPVMVNKICLSNFVSKNFLADVSYCFDLLPKNLRHGYTTSGQSECVDKIVKSIWSHTKKSQLLLTFDGHFFGIGSFLARSLSTDDSYFKTKKFPSPNKDNWQKVLQDVTHFLNHTPALGVWIEPILQKNCQKIPRGFLVEIKKLCKAIKTPLIYNETASGSYRYQRSSLYVSGDPMLAPDMGMIYLGGQGGLVFTGERYFVNTPLMLISTWDGDELSFAKYTYAQKEIQKNKDEYFLTLDLFQKNVARALSKVQWDEMNLEGSIGHFKGPLPLPLQKHFRKNKNHYYFITSYQTMKRFNQRETS